MLFTRTYTIEIMSTYRDGGFQARHLAMPHHVLYNAWHQDICTAPDEPRGKGDGRPTALAADFWDRFQEEAWLRESQLEPNGMVTFPGCTPASLFDPRTVKCAQLYAHGWRDVSLPSGNVPMSGSTSEHVGPATASTGNAHNGAQR